MKQFKNTPLESLWLGFKVTTGYLAYVLGILLILLGLIFLLTSGPEFAIMGIVASVLGTAIVLFAGNLSVQLQYEEIERVREYRSEQD